MNIITNVYVSFFNEVCFMLPNLLSSNLPNVGNVAIRRDEYCGIDVIAFGVYARVFSLRAFNFCDIHRVKRWWRGQWGCRDEVSYIAKTSVWGFVAFFTCSMLCESLNEHIRGSTLHAIEFYHTYMIFIPACWCMRIFVFDAFHEFSVEIQFSWYTL